MNKFKFNFTQGKTSPMKIIITLLCVNERQIRKCIKLRTEACDLRFVCVLNQKKRKNPLKYRKSYKSLGLHQKSNIISYLECACEVINSRNFNVATSRAALDESPPPIGTLVLITASKPGTGNP